MPVFNNMLAGASGQGGAGYEIERSLRFNSADSAYLSKNFASAGNRKTWTWSAWVKFTNFGQASRLFAGGVDNDNRTIIHYDTSDNSLKIYSTVNGAVKANLKTVAAFRDPSAFYQIVVSFDAANTTASIYINGVSQSLTVSTAVNNVDHNINNNVAQKIGQSVDGSVQSDFYLADVHFIDGQALAPTDFGETDEFGVWQPKKFAGSYTLPASGSGIVYSSLVSGPTSASPYEIERAFDGNLTTFGDHSGANTTWTFTRTFTSVTSLRVYIHGGNSTNTVTTVGGNGTQTDTISTYFGPGWHTISLSNTGSTINSIAFTRGGSGNPLSVYAIEVNGTVLVDGTPAQGANSFHLDFADNSSNAALGTDTSGNSNTWTVNNLTAASNPNYTSNLVFTGGNYGGGHSADKAFDGNINTSALTANQGTDQYVTFTPGAAIPYSTSVEFTATTTDQLVSLNGGTEIVCTAGAWTTLASGSGTITEIKARANSSSFGRIAAIRVDGTILIAGDPPSSDSLRDSPSQIAGQTDSGAGGEVVGNYATLNPLDSPVSNSGSLTNGNLNLNGAVAWSGNRATIAYPSSGKWYYETQVNGSATSRNSNSQYSVVGLCKTSDSFTGSDSTNNILWLGDNGYGRNFSSSGTTDIFGANIDQGKIIGLAVNMDNNTFEYFVDGVSKQTGTINITSGTSLSPYMASYGNSQTSLIANFGQRAFAYTAPSGYKSLNTANLPEPTIADGSKYFDTKSWTGNSGSRSFTGFSFSPSFVWTKIRSSAYDHVLWDAVRGAGVSKELVSNDSRVEGGASTNAYGYLSAFNPDGFSTTAGSSNNYYFNQSGQTYVSWAWDAASSNTTIAAGDLNSSVYDQSQTWSNHLTASGSGFRSGNPATNAFNGGSQNAVTNDNNGTLTLDLSSYNLSGPVRVKFGTGNSGTYTATFVGSSGTQTDSQSYAATQPAAYTSSYNVGTITSVSVTTTSNSQMNLVAVEINGKELVDSGVTPPNVPSIASTVRANPSAGFSIVSYTGTGANATFGHGLNSAPKFIITKQTDANNYWLVGHEDLGFTTDGYLRLNDSTAKENGNGNVWQLTNPSSSVVFMGGGSLNSSSGNYIAYCFAPVEGYSSFGSYEGNGSTDGPFVFTGFKIAFLMIKNISAASNWIILDNARDPINDASKRLSPNLSNTEDPIGTLDFTSTGFKIRRAGQTENINGNTYVYIAFAEHPFKTARAR